MLKSCFSCGDFATSIFFKMGLDGCEEFELNKAYEKAYEENATFESFI